MDMLAGMGFARQLCGAALAQAGNDINQAVELLLTNQVRFTAAASASAPAAAAVDLTAEEEERPAKVAKTQKASPAQRGGASGGRGKGKPVALVEESKNARAACKACKVKIQKTELRVGTTLVTQWGEGVGWYHAACYPFGASADAPSMPGYSSLPAASQQVLQDAVSGKLPKKPVVPGAAAASTGAAMAAAAASPPTAAAGKQLAAAVAPSTKGVVGLSEALPQERGIAKIEYCKVAKPSDCMHCGGGITFGSIRVGVVSDAFAYEGLQTRWIHHECALAGAQGGIQRLSQMHGWDRVGYDLSKEIRQMTGEMLTDKQETWLQQQMEPLEDLQDLLLAEMKRSVMIDVLELNGMNPKEMLIKLSKGGEIDMAVLVADGMKNGLCANCPVCNNASLTQCSGRIVCWGFMNGNTKCVFKAPLKDVKRFAWKLPSKVIAAQWCQNWMQSASSHFVYLSEEDAGAESVAAGAGPDTSGSSKMKVNELKEELMARGLPLSGNKGELVERLEEALAKDARNSVPGEKRSIAKAAGGGGVTIPNQKKKLKLKDASSSAASAADASAPLAAASAPPRREKPMAGSPILEVHVAYKQHAVDRYEDAKVVVERGTEVFNAMMNDVNLSKGLNRYYVIQVLELPSGFQFFRHEGRVGQDVESVDLSRDWVWGNDNYKVYPQTSKAAAIEFFKKWFLKKTGNEWDRRHEFKKLPGMYNFVELSTVNKDAIKRGKQSEGTATTACSLKSSVAQLVDLMFDEDTIMHSLQEVGLNLDEMPLGAVTAEVVEKARAILERIKQHLESSAKQATRKSAAAQAKAVNAQQVWDQQLQSLTESFYLAIPSVETAAIKTKEALDRKVQLVNMLGDIALTQKALKKQKRASKDKKENKHAALEPHPLDVKYFSLSCSLSKLSKTDPVWTTIDQYFQSSVNASPLAVDPYGMSGFSRRHGTKVKLLEVFDMSREGEADRYASFDALGGRTLLWHGTNVAVAAAICSSGLRIMPNSGGRVGRGIYLANQSVKSGHYVQPAKDGTGIMFLVEAAMGTPTLITRDDPQLKKAPLGTDSVVAVGRIDPDPAGDKIFNLDGRDVIVPAGRVALSKAPGAESSTFIQSEHLIYNESQVRLRYLVKMQWT